MAEEKKEDEKTDEEKAQDKAKADFDAAMAAMPAMPGPSFPAARVGDPHLCPMVEGLKPHVGGPIAKGLPTVLIGGMPAARATDQCTCVGPVDMIARGSATVLIGGMPAARMLDSCGHGGAITMGMMTVLVGG